MGPTTLEEDLEEHIQYLRLAIAEAEKLPFDGVNPVILATGYSRELPGNTHAEANALTKARSLSSEQLVSLFPKTAPMPIRDILALTDIYTTLEPCSVRTSGLAPCADALIASQVRRCFIGVGEPNDFVDCEGARKLQDAGIEVIWLPGLQHECLAVARRGHWGKEI